MHILLVADGRSAITAGWLRMLKGLDHQVSLVSTFPCDPPRNAKLVRVLPVGFSAFSGSQVHHSGTPTEENQGTMNWQRRAISSFRPAFLSARAWLAPLTLRKYQAHFIKLVNDLKPDLVHALRIPFEGMLAFVTPKAIPFLVSIWGNDLTFHAETSPLMKSRTQQVLKRANGLLADTQRDIRLAEEWGLEEETPTLVVPGNGGLDLKKMEAVINSHTLSINLPHNRPLVINPRGFRPGSVHQDTFFRSVPLVLEKVPDAFFICTAMQGQPTAENWVKKLGIQDHILLLPYLSQDQLWQIYAHSQVYVSLSSHDGTPNTFLEALACGCFPVVGDIASLREWVSDGNNGLLVDPRNPVDAAKAVIQSLSDTRLFKKTVTFNISMIKARAEISIVSNDVQKYLENW